MRIFMFAYLVCFALDVWPKYMVTSWQRKAIYSIAHEVAETDGSLQEDLRLMNIAGWESGFRRDAKGKAGERGPWQIMPPAVSFGAKEALSRMRIAGMVSYVGCRRAEDEVVLPGGTKMTCQKMIDNRIRPADEYLENYPPPSEESDEREEALDPEGDFSPWGAPQANGGTGG
jgi:hypothetical protein